MLSRPFALVHMTHHFNVDPSHAQTAENSGAYDPTTTTTLFVV